MSKITATDVNKLRKQTGAGMMDCKKALVEAEGDFDNAIDILRKKGQKVAAKRADRDSSEGAAMAGVNHNSTVGYIISLNCETDFVAKNHSFVSMAKDILNSAIENDVKSKEELLTLSMDGMKLKEKLIEQTGVIGEKIEINSFEREEAAFVGSYVHAGNKIASLVGFSKAVNGGEEVAKDVAMQVAAMNPVALDKNAVDTKTVERELEIARDLAKQEGKPEAMLDKIAMGRLNKFLKKTLWLLKTLLKTLRCRWRPMLDLLERM